MRPITIRWASLEISKELPTSNKLGASLTKENLRLNQVTVKLSLTRDLNMEIQDRKMSLTSPRLSLINRLNQLNNIVGSL
jgi:hypothetical protein